MWADRRLFLRATGSAFAALAASGCMRTTLSGAGGGTFSYGPLMPDLNGLIDLPAGFTYRVISEFGDAMHDGGTVPDAADGMGCFELGRGKLALVRNHELRPNQGHLAGATLASGYARGADGKVLPGGTVNLVLDARTLKVEHQARTLAGTIRNCAGGTTPWGSWLTCEEPGADVLPVQKDHGYVFEIPARATGLVDPVPLKAMGRFNHEAACVDPATGIVYLTEDREDGLFYRFIPNTLTVLAAGGKLQALAIDGLPDARNWSAKAFAPASWQAGRWIDLDDVEAPADDLRLRGAMRGATLFARAEGIHMGVRELYFCCTSGGAAKLGQVFRLRPQASAQDRLQLFYESTSPDEFNYGDNLTVAPNGHLVVCEDQYTETVYNHLRGITPSGQAYPLAFSRIQTEWAGACFSPDGKVLFVNLYSPARTFAITGPWRA